MITFNPQLHIQASDQANGRRIWRFNFYMPSALAYTAKGSLIEVACDASDQVGFDIAKSTHSANAFDVLVTTGGVNGQQQQKKFGEVQFVGEILPETEVSTTNGLRDALGAAFFKAMSEAAFSTSTASVVHSEPAATPCREEIAATAIMSMSTPKPKSKFSVRALVNKKNMVIAVVMMGVASVVYGVVSHRGGQDSPNNMAEIMGRDSYAEVRRNVEQQINQAVNAKDPATGLRGENVALATMKAMGLDPGKANAGCLVGVR